MQLGIVTTQRNWPQIIDGSHVTLSEEERIVADKPWEKGKTRAQHAYNKLDNAHMIVSRILRDLPMMVKGRKLNVWRKEAVHPWACQRHHLRELFVNWDVNHVLEPNTTSLSFMSRNSGLNHCQEYELVIIFAADNPAGKPD